MASSPPVTPVPAPAADPLAAPVPGQTRLPDGALMAQRDAPLGGQAVLEGVMMRGIGTWAVAVRVPPPPPRGPEPAGRDLASEASPAGEPPAALGPTGDAADHGEIEVSTFGLQSVLRRHRVLRLPVLRGVVALGESMMIGFRALGISANAQLPEEEKDISGGVWAGTVVVAVAFAVGLFFVVPVGLTSLIKGNLHSSALFWLVEGIVRTTIFLGYLLLLSRLRDLRRVFEYHGAEHKTIACFEAEQPLTAANAARFSRLHPRCGTSFLLIVMIVAIFVFAPIGLPAWYWLLATRILGVPLIAGLSFELIKFVGRNRRRPWVRAIMWPGLQLQKLTTREPNPAQLEVAIAALEAVLAVETPGQEDPEALVGLEVVA